MRKIHIYALCLAAFALCAPAHAAPQIRRADAVASAPSAQTGQSQTASLVPTALGLVAGIMSLNQEMRTLDERCRPSSSEIRWLNDLMKEWAKAGAPKPKPEENMGRMRPCDGTFANDVGLSGPSRANRDVCFEVFSGQGNDDMIWAGFPRAADTVCRCKGAHTTGCSGCRVQDQEWFSNAYEIFALIDWSDNDFIAREASILPTWRRKVDECSPVRLAQHRRELWGGFAMQTAASLGQQQDMATTMQNVNVLMQAGQGSAFGTIAQIPLMMMAPQLMGGADPMMGSPMMMNPMMGGQMGR